MDRLDDRADRADVADLADRAAVVDVCVRYARALDRRDWELLATCFTPDVVVDFDGMDRIEGVGTLVAACRSVLEPLSVSQHLLGTHHVEVDGDTARSECYLHAQHVRAELAPDDKYVIAGTYTDALVRTHEGWRIANRRLAVAWTQGNPDVVAPPDDSTEERAMKAAVYDHNGGPEVFRYVDVADPEVRPGGLLLEVEAIGIQGGDLINRREGRLVTVPHIVGYQAAGVVREVGAGVEGFAPGDRVVSMMMSGSHAELASVPARKTWAIPATLSFEHAAAVPVEFGTADDCLFEFGHLQAGETVLVQAGSGGVGVAAIQLAKAAGATVLATSVADGRLERLADLGLDHGIDYTTTDVPAEVMRLTDGRGVDLVVDPVGGRALEGSIAAAAYRGRISWMGNAGGAAQPPNIWPLMEKNGTITTIFFAMEQSKQPERTYAVIERNIARIGAGELRAVVDRTFPLADVAEAHRHVESGVGFGRTVMIP